jgi:hypothetical protein
LSPEPGPGPETGRAGGARGPVVTRPARRPASAMSVGGDQRPAKEKGKIGIIKKVRPLCKAG